MEKFEEIVLFFYIGKYKNKSKKKLKSYKHGKNVVNK